MMRNWYRVELPSLARIAAFAAAVGATLASAAPGMEGPLRVHAKNPRYFSDGSGKAVYLTGSHTWNNFKDMGPADPPEPMDFAAYLDFLVERHHNFIRLWTWELTRYGYDGRQTYAEPFPWPRTGPGNARDGKPKLDLSKLDPAFFARLRARVEEAGKRDICVSVMLFEGHGLHASDAPWCWDGHPMNAANNINRIDSDPNEERRGIEIKTLAIRDVNALQEAYVRKVLDTLGDLDNVLYEIVNESGAYSTQWQYHFIRFIHEYEKRLPKRHPVGMTFQYARDPAQRGTNAALFASPADWISPNPEGGYRDNPPAADGAKVILADTDHLWGIGGNPQWVWKSFCRGLNPIFMDPYHRPAAGDKKDKRRTTWTDHLAGTPKLDSAWEPLRRAMGQTRRFAERIDLASVNPAGGLASTGYCLARAAENEAEYLIYAPEGGPLTVDLSATPGKLAVEWFNPTSGEAIAARAVTGGAKRTLVAPFEGEAVVYLSTRGNK